MNGGPHLAVQAFVLGSRGVAAYAWSEGTEEGENFSSEWPDQGEIRHPDGDT